MLFKLSNLNSNLALTLGYLNPVLNNLAQSKPPGRKRSTVYFFGHLNLSKPQAEMSLQGNVALKLLQDIKLSRGYATIRGRGVWPKLGKFMDQEGGVFQTECYGTYHADLTIINRITKTRLAIYAKNENELDLH